ncbi:MAG: hypothetical protein QNK37_04170 [Acidobacteriota bacterium]|nr:hypothetical protein [Acidobacteriota bacterium]
MSGKYFSLPNVEEISELTIPRARLLYNAITKHRDFKVLQIYKGMAENNITLEYITVDVECDEVPPDNPYGIHFRERLVFSISTDKRYLVKVNALRKEFPLLLHQYSVGVNQPVSLCLYYEPSEVVLRTWTPEAFLKRTQWWLEQSARGNIHAADQQVDQLFFVTNYELVLPWNFNELRKESCSHYNLSQCPQRPDGGITFFVYFSNRESDESIALLEIELPPIVHGQVEREPFTLGELFDILQSRNADLLTALKEAVKERVGQDGVSVESDGSHLIILLHVPVCRSIKKKPERIIRRAFLMKTEILKLGHKIGALWPYEKKYFQIPIFGEQKPTTEWREEKLFPMEVLQANDSSAARRQSGLKNKGPEGVLVGAGSLGSSILNLWSRCGWGQWTILAEDGWPGDTCMVFFRPKSLRRDASICIFGGELRHPFTRVWFFRAENICIVVKT